MRKCSFFKTTNVNIPVSHNYFNSSIRGCKKTSMVSSGFLGQDKSNLRTCKGSSCTYLEEGCKKSQQLANRNKFFRIDQEVQNSLRKVPISHFEARYQNQDKSYRNASMPQHHMDGTSLHFELGV